jgi:DNA-binding protein YbaB
MNKVQRVRALEEKLSAKRITVESDDKSVRATVDGYGSLLDLKICRDVITRMNAPRLERDILLTVRKAGLVVDRLHRQLAESLLEEDK